MSPKEEAESLCELLLNIDSDTKAMKNENQMMVETRSLLDEVMSAYQAIEPANF